MITKERLHFKGDENQFELRRLEIKAREDDLDLAQSGSFDITKNIRLVPEFVEKDVEKYLSHFERVALTLKWPRDVWPLLLQSVLTGHAQEVYAALSSVEQSAN